MPGQQVLLRSFDVDDPFVHPQYDGTALDSNDITGDRGDDNFGTSPAGQLSASALTLDSQGEAIAEYAVSWQPGNNFRVAAILDTPGAQAHLDQLQVTNANASLYVAAGTNVVVGFAGNVSPMLTVWRKLHLEFDSMAAPPTSGLNTVAASGHVTKIRSNYPTAGRSQVWLAHLNVNGPDYNLFERGKITIVGTGSFKVLKSAYTGVLLGGGSASTMVEIDGTPNVAIGTSVTLYDDDDRFLTNDPPLYPSDLSLQSPPLPLDSRSGEFVSTNQARFAPAYIQLVDVNALGWNTQRTITFLRHAEAELFGGPFNSGNQQLQGADRPEFWAYPVVFGYQGSYPDDGDPDPESTLKGITIKKGLSPNGYSVVYVESIRDRAFFSVPDASFTVSVASLRNSYLGELYTTIAHEIGHAPGDTSQGSDHREDGLMQRGPVDVSRLSFTPQTLRRFRNATRWIE